MGREDDEDKHKDYCKGGRVGGAVCGVHAFVCAPCLWPGTVSVLRDDDAPLLFLEGLCGVNDAGLSDSQYVQSPGAHRCVFRHQRNARGGGADIPHKEEASAGGGLAFPGHLKWSYRRRRAYDSFQRSTFLGQRRVRGAGRAYLRFGHRCYRYETADEERHVYGAYLR